MQKAQLVLLIAAAVFSLACAVPQLEESAEIEDVVEGATEAVVMSLPGTLKKPAYSNPILLRSFARELNRIKKQLTVKRNRLVAEIRKLKKRIYFLKRCIANVLSRIAMIKRKAALAKKIALLKARKKKAGRVHALKIKLRCLKRSLLWVGHLKTKVHKLRRGWGSIKKPKGVKYEADLADLQAHLADNADAAEHLTEVPVAQALLDLQATREAADEEDLDTTAQKALETNKLRKLVYQMRQALLRKMRAIRRELRRIHKNVKIPAGLKRGLNALRARLAGLKKRLAKAQALLAKLLKNRFLKHVNGELRKIAVIEKHIYRVSRCQKKPKCRRQLLEAIQDEVADAEEQTD